MATYEADQILTSSFLSVGDDVYLKPSGTDWTGDPWVGDHILATPASITASSYSVIYSITAASLDTSKSYVVYQNVYNATFTVDYGSDINQILSSAIVTSDVGARVYFKGSDLPSGLVAGKPYWAINIVNGVAFEVEATQGSGTPVDLGDNGSGSLSYTITSQRSSSDQIVGTIQADASSLVGEGQTSRIEANVATILSTTNVLYADWLDGGRLDLILDAIKAKTDLINSGTVNAVDQDNTRINITRNDAYDGTANPTINWTVSKDYTSGWTGTLTIRHRVSKASLLSKAITVTDATTLSVSLDAADTTFTALTTNADFGPHSYDIEMVSGSSKQTAVQGPAVIYQDETTA